jgi:hypothetical protein
MPKQIRTKFPGVTSWRIRDRNGGVDKAFYIQYRGNGKPVEELAGWSGQDGMTPAKV